MRKAGLGHTGKSGLESMSGEKPLVCGGRGRRRER